MSVELQMEELKLQLGKLKLIKYKDNLIKNLRINTDNVEKLEVKANYHYHDNDNDEYSAFYDIDFEVSYDYTKNNNKPISVKYTANYESTQTYDNRYEPDESFNSDLQVDPDDIEYDYATDYSIDPEETDEDGESWCDLINTVLGEIECEGRNLRDLVESITDSGNI